MTVRFSADFDPHIRYKKIAADCYLRRNIADPLANAVPV